MRACAERAQSVRGERLRCAAVFSEKLRPLVPSGLVPSDSGAVGQWCNNCMLPVPGAGASSTNVLQSG